MIPGVQRPAIRATPLHHHLGNTPCPLHLAYTADQLGRLGLLLLIKSLTGRLLLRFGGLRLGAQCLYLIVQGG